MPLRGLAALPVTAALQTVLDCAVTLPHLEAVVVADSALRAGDVSVEELRDATDGHGADVILDNMGAKYLSRNVDTLATAGRLVIIGLQGGRKGTLDVGALLRLGGHVIATSLRGRPVAEKAEICAAVEAEVWPLLASGAIEPAPQTRFPLADAAAAHRRLESGDNLGKIVLTTDGL